nr:unnamed protein product [Digitaria exilis]
MELATGALSNLLPVLHSLLREEYNLQKSTKKNLQFLERELESMDIVLRKVGNVPLDQLDEELRIWARDIRELSYDIEDVVDTFLVRVKGRHPHYLQGSEGLVKRMVTLFKKGSTRREISKEVKDIKDRIKEVANRRCDLRGCGHLNLRYIANLIHLRLPNGLRNMTSLEVLETVRIDEHSINIVEDLGHLCQLRVVHIDFNLQRWEGLRESMCKALMESLNNLQKIQSLEVTDFNGEDNHMNEGWVLPPRLRRFVMWTASSLSPWINPALLPLLSYLDIEVHKIGGNDIQILGKLPSLRHLWLGVSGHIQELPMEEWFMVSADAFPCARVCKFFNFVTVPSIFSRGAMPKVEHLEFCIRSRHFFADGGDLDLNDLDMGHLPSLERVVVHLHSERADSKEEVMEVEKGLRHAVCVHPNSPSIDVRHH